jgi:hypothetical protein
MSMISKQVGAVAVLAMSALVSMSVQAQNGPDALRIVKDATTGELRAPNADEHKAMDDKRSVDEGKQRGARRTALRTEITMHTHKHASKIRGARMTDESMHNVTVVRLDDGTLQQQCDDPTHNHAASISTTSVAVKSTKLETE